MCLSHVPNVREILQSELVTLTTLRSSPAHFSARVFLLRAKLMPAVSRVEQPLAHAVIDFKANKLAVGSFFTFLFLLYCADLLYRSARANHSRTSTQL